MLTATVRLGLARLTDLCQLFSICHFFLLLSAHWLRLLDVDVAFAHVPRRRRRRRRRRRLLLDAFLLTLIDCS